MVTAVFTAASLLVSIARYDSAGVYLTLADFERHHISYLVADRNFSIGLRKVSLVVNGKKMSFERTSIYGIRRFSNDYRYIGEKQLEKLKLDDNFYKVESRAPLYIYSYSYTFTGSQLLFSLTPTSAPLRLTVANLTKCFPNQPEMIREIEQDKQLRFSMAARDPDGQLRVVKILTKYLPAPTK